MGRRTRTVGSRCPHPAGAVAQCSQPTAREASLRIRGRPTTVRPVVGRQIVALYHWTIALGPVSVYLCRSYPRNDCQPARHPSRRAFSSSRLPVPQPTHPHVRRTTSPAGPGVCWAPVRRARAHRRLMKRRRIDCMNDPSSSDGRFDSATCSSSRAAFLASGKCRSSWVFCNGPSVFISGQCK